MNLKQRSVAVFAVVAILSVSLLSGNIARAQAAESTVAEQQVRRIYWVTLGREGEPAGVRAWTQAMLDGQSAEATAWVMARSDEARSKSSGNSIVNAYLWGLEREPEAAGLAAWASVSEGKALVGIANSAEHQQKIATRPTPALVSADLVATQASHPAGWVDAGHGVYVPPVLLAIRRCESTDNYKAQNPVSSASGAYQFLRASWAYYGHAARFGTSTAAAATPAQQDQAAVITWQRSGTRPWNASSRCW